jgi:outer membrane protein assembly factor BamB
MVLALLLVSTMLSMPAAVAQGEPQEPAPMFRFGPDNAGAVAGEAPVNGTVLWTTELGSGVFSSPVVTGGRVYVGTMGGRVLCMNAYSGAIQWYYDTGEVVESSPAVVDGRVYIGSDDRHVYCLDADDGTLIWRYLTGGEVKSSPAVVDGRVFVGSNDFLVYSLDAEDGTELWNFSTGGYVYSSPAVSEGRVYFGSCDGKVYSVKIGNGEEVWSFQAEYIPAAPALWRDLVIVGTYDDHIYYLDRRTGEEVLNVTGEISDIYSSAAVVESGDEMSFPEMPITFVSDSAGRMIVVGADGKLENVSFPKGGTSSPLLIKDFPRQYDHLLVYGSDDGYLHAREYRNPNIVRPAIYEPLVEWDVELGVAVKSSPFAYHGRIYVGVELEDGKGALACIGPWPDSTEPILSVWTAPSEEKLTVIVTEFQSNGIDGIRVIMNGLYYDAEFANGSWRADIPSTPPEGLRNITAQGFIGGEIVAIERIQAMVLVEGWNQVDVSIVEPLMNEKVDGVVLIKGTVSSNYSIEFVHVWWDDNKEWDGPDFPRGEISDDNWTAAMETGHLKDGWHTLHVVANDGYRVGIASVRVIVREEPEEEIEIGYIDIAAVLILILLFLNLLLRKPPRVPEGSSPGR